MSDWSAYNIWHWIWNKLNNFLNTSPLKRLLGDGKTNTSKKIQCLYVGYWNMMTYR